MMRGSAARSYDTSSIFRPFRALELGRPNTQGYALG